VPQRLLSEARLDTVIRPWGNGWGNEASDRLARLGVVIDGWTAFVSGGSRKSCGVSAGGELGCGALPVPLDADYQHRALSYSFPA